MKVRNWSKNFHVRLIMKKRSEVDEVAFFHLWVWSKRAAGNGKPGWNLERRDCSLLHARRGNCCRSTHIVCFPTLISYINIYIHIIIFFSSTWLCTLSLSILSSPSFFTSCHPSIAVLCCVSGLLLSSSAVKLALNKDLETKHSLMKRTGLKDEGWCHAEKTSTHAEGEMKGRSKEENKIFSHPSLFYKWNAVKWPRLCGSSTISTLTSASKLSFIFKGL